MINRSQELTKVVSGQSPSAVASNPPTPYSATLFPADTKALFGQLFRILHKQRWKVVLFVAAAILLALALQFFSPRLYSATALLRLDRHSAPGVVGQEASQISAINDMDVIIDTDMEVAQSDPVVRPVAEKFHLIGKSHAKNGPIELAGLKVTRPANTYLIRITYRAWKDPQLAADVANGIAESLVKHLHESLDRSYNDLSGAMRHDMEQLRSKMDDSSKRLTQYEKELNMVDPEQRSTVLTSRLTQLLAEYTQAQADRLHKQATLDGVTKSPTLAATQATEADRQRQSLLDEAIEHLSTARQQFVAARSYYGENHPDYRRAKQQLDEAEAQVEKARVATNDKAAAEYRQSLAREVLLKNQFDGTKAEVDGLKAHALAYSQLKTEADNDRRMYMDLEVRMREADVNRPYRDAAIQYVSPALPPGAAIFPKLMVNLPVAFLLALLFGVLGSIAVDALDNTFSNAEDVSARLQLEVMATLPHVRRLTAKQAGQPSTVPVLYSRSADSVRDFTANGLYKDAIRLLRDDIRRAGTGQSLQTLLITSSIAAEGKSTTAVHLGEACAQSGKRVLLIDADLQRPSLHKKFSLHTNIGLADVLAHRVPAEDVIVEAEVVGLFVMPVGAPILNAADLINLDFATILNEVRQNFDLVIVDAPPVLGMRETQELASMVDGVLVVAKAEGTSAKELSQTLTALNRSRANVLGVVMNQVKLSSLNGFAHYYPQYRQDDQA